MRRKNPLPIPRVVEIRHGEGRPVATAVATLFFFFTGHGILETARDSLFLARLPPARLPWVYLVMAVLGFAAVKLAARLPVRRGGGRLAWILAASAAVTAGLSVVVARAASPFAPYVVYVWVGVSATLAMIELWQLLGDIFTVTQAKRVFSVIGAGAGLGVAAGSLAAATLASRIGTSGLLLAGAGAVAIAAAFPAFLPRAAPDAGPGAPAVDVVPAHHLLRAEPYARRLLALAIVTTVALTVVDYLFKSTVAASVGPDRLAGFFGRYYAAVSTAGLLVQVVGTPWILRTLGAARGVALLPVLVLAGAAGFVVAPTLAAALAMKSADGAFRQSVLQTGLEVLFLPLGDAARRSLRSTVELFGQRGAQALASAGILAAVAVGAGPRELAAALVALTALWLAALRGITHDYVSLLRRQLRSEAFDASRSLPELDISALEVLLVALNSKDEREAIAALGLLEEQGKAHLVPPLLAYHPSRIVALRALEGFARHGRHDVLPLLGPLAEGGDAELCGAALRIYHALAPRESVEARLAHADPTVSAAILVGFADKEAWTPEIARRAADIAGGTNAAMKVELARAIAARPNGRWIPTLRRLAGSRHVEVRRAVAEAAGKLGDAALVPALIDMLATRDVRDAARAALAGLGEPVVPALLDALRDGTTPLDVRRHLPGTLVHFRGSSAARALIEHLDHEPDGTTRYKILRALGRIRAEDPTVVGDPAAIRRHFVRTLERIVELTAYRVAVRDDLGPPSPRRELALCLLEQKEGRALERACRLLALLDAAHDDQLLHAGLTHGDAKRRAASREILANHPDRDARTALAVLVDDLPDEEKLARLRGWRGASPAVVPLERLARDRSQAVRRTIDAYLAERRAAAIPVQRAHA